MNPSHVITVHDATAQSPGTKLGKFGSLGFGRKTNKWGLGGMFGHGDKGHTLPPVDEMAIAASSSSTPSLKRTQSSSTDSRSLAEMSPIQEVPTMDPKKARKEAERLQRDANKQRRALAEKAQREQARAVMQKRNKLVSGDSDDIEWKYQYTGSLVSNQRTEDRVNKPKHGSSSGPIRQNQVQGASGVGSAAVNATARRFDSSIQSSAWRRDERLPKARRREFDDDHSMSSSDMHSMGRVSAMSFATVDSDPGPTVPRRPSLFGINRMTSRSSLRTGTSFDDFPSSARSSNSFSVGESLAHDFHIRANVDGSMLQGTISPPPIQTLSLSPSPTWMQELNDRGLSSRREHSSFISKPPTIPEDASDMVPGGPYYPHDSSRSHSSSPRGGPHIVINPMFRVVSPVITFPVRTVTHLCPCSCLAYRTIILTSGITTFFTGQCVSCPVRSSRTRFL
jgi:hypothetical protein